MRFYVELDDSKIVTFGEPEQHAPLSDYPQRYLVDAKRIWKEDEHTGVFYQMRKHELYAVFDYVESLGTSEEQIKEFFWIKLSAHNA